MSGCSSQGDTVDEALAKIREAIELCIADMRANNEPLTIPLHAELRRGRPLWLCSEGARRNPPDDRTAAVTVV